MFIFSSLLSNIKWDSTYHWSPGRRTYRWWPRSCRERQETRPWTSNNTVVLQDRRQRTSLVLPYGTLGFQVARENLYFLVAVAAAEQYISLKKGSALQRDLMLVSIDTWINATSNNTIAEFIFSLSYTTNLSLDPDDSPVIKFKTFIIRRRCYRLLIMCPFINRKDSSLFIEISPHYRIDLRCYNSRFSSVAAPCAVEMIGRRLVVQMCATLSGRR